MNGRHPNQVELRRAESAIWGPRPDAGPAARPATAKIRRWQPFRNQAGTMRGYLSAELPSGMIVNDLKLMLGPAGKLWIATPSIKQLDRDGQPRLDANGRQTYAQLVEFRDRAASDKFRDLVLEALQREHPEALDGGRA
jgi:DNA-binding cell septation regulator SpoVG